MSDKPACTEKEGVVEKKREVESIDQEQQIEPQDKTPKLGKRYSRDHLSKKNNICPLCTKKTGSFDISRGTLHSEAFNDFIRGKVPSWSPEQRICHKCLSHFRAEYVATTIREQKGELTKLEEEVIRSLQEQAIVSENINTQFEQSLTWGQLLADKMASFGGSWSFISAFIGILVIWVVVNTLPDEAKQFDPYPYIFLNLCLSCIAALQAPIIMMSQRRQEARDRFRSEQDYLVNLKAELEIRQLSRKLDQLMSHQWQSLLEIQNIQTELLEELLQMTGKKKP